MGEVLSEQQRAFLEASHGAVMATVDPSVAWSTCSPPSGPTRRRAEEDCWHG
jgi:hypothetical protein